MGLGKVYLHTHYLYDTCMTASFQWGGLGP